MKAPIRVFLEKPSLRREGEFLAMERASRRLHRPWLMAPSTPERYRRFLARCRKRSYCAFFIVLRDTHEIAGVVSLSEIVRGLAQNAYLAYYAFQAHAGQGLMHEGVSLVLDHAFRELALHRLEANVQPANEASLGLIRRLGFRREGFSPKYLKIGGRWCDHERWAILSEEWRTVRARRSRP